MEVSHHKNTLREFRKALLNPFSNNTNSHNYNMNKRVLGLDISRNFAVGFLLDSFPTIPPLKFFDVNKKTLCKRLDNTSEGVKLFQDFNPDLVILEPTGYWYSQFWVHQAKLLDIPVFWVSHAEVKYHRLHYGFKSKDDDSDAFTIALMYHDIGAYDELGNPRLIYNYNHESIDRLRETFLRREQVDKHWNLLINQLRQRLAVEFPEICQRDFSYLTKWGFNPTLGHLTGQRTPNGTYKNRRMPKSSVGIGVSLYSQELASDIIRDQLRLTTCEQEMEVILQSFPDFYKVFEQFHYGIVLKSLILLQTYPMERFLINGKPWRKNGHDMSLRKFQAFSGLSFTYEKSGDTSAKQGKVKKKWHGSDLVRSHLYAHALVTICNPKCSARSETMLRLKDAWFNERERDGVKYPAFKALGKDGICRLLFYELRLLYQALK